MKNTLTTAVTTRNRQGFAVNSMKNHPLAIHLLSTIDRRLWVGLLTAEADDEAQNSEPGEPPTHGFGETIPHMQSTP